MKRGVLILILLVIIGGFGAALTISPVTVDTTTKVYNFYDWRGAGSWAGNELFDAPEYVSGFNGDGHSDKFVASGQAGRTQATCTRFSNMLYRFWFKPASGTYPAEHVVTPTNLNFDSKFVGNIPGHGGFVLLKEDNKVMSAGQGCPDRTTAPASLMTVVGNFYGELLVELYGERLDILYDYWAILASDRAALNPGWAVISIQNSESLIEVGEDLRVHYDVGAACAKSVDPAATNPCGWTLMLRNRDSGATPSGWTDKTLGDFTSGTISVTVQSSWFVLGEHNEFEIKLFNQVNLQDAKLFVTIDDRTLAPGTPTVTISPAPPYREGMTVTVSLKAEPNTKNSPVVPIVDFHVIARQGDRILGDVRVPAKADGTATATFVIADESIDIQVEATSFDGLRTSGVDRRILVVADTDQNNNPPPGAGSLLWIMLIIAGAVLILIGIVVPLPWMLRVGAFGIAFILILIGYLSVTGAL